MFLPILSRESLNSQTVDRNNITKLNEHSACDNVLLEYQLALELRKVGLIELICPILIGDYDNQINEYSNYFGSGCCPNVSNVRNVIIQSIEERIYYEMNRQSLGCPLLGSLSVGTVFDMIMKNQGVFIEGEENNAYESVVTIISTTLDTLLSSKSQTGSSARSVLSTPLYLSYKLYSQKTV